jgi:2-succinyl-5-enolpyruvyl-6-hydroxy-3-cyclohexene-1-carboxylate synthase
MAEMVRPEDLQATFCATLVDEWVRAGVRHAVVAPGSRSTPLALALADDGRLRVHVHQDERSAGFLAVGLALGGWEPAVVLTTSGTAAVELHAAVVEADLAHVPMLVCTADRPPELLDVGAPQAIDQTHLYGRSPRWFHAPGVADQAAMGRWRAMAARAYAESMGPAPGPVHLNLAFREPLLGTVGELPAGRAGDAPWTWRADPDEPAQPAITLAGDLAGRRGVFLAGPGSGGGPALDLVARALGWPVLAAPQADVWAVEHAVVPHADGMLRVGAVAEELRPEVIVRLGGPLASRVVGEWAAASGAPEIAVSGVQSWVDPHGTAAVVLAADPAALVEAWVDEADVVEPVDGGSWRNRWDELGRLAATAVEVTLTQHPVAEPAVARALVGALPEGACLVVSSSMPIRDLEWFAAPGSPITVHANRGANGIDGVVSTAVGVAAATGGPTALLVGDLAFVHDSNGLLGADGRGVQLVIVVVDNDGGGIFSFLPQASSVADDRFEQLYGTPHGIDLVALATAFGADARHTSDVAHDVRAAFDAGGVHVLVAASERSSNVDVHAQLNHAVAAAVAPSVTAG